MAAVLLIAAAWFLWGAGPAFAADTDLERARRLAREGRCLAVLAELERLPDSQEGLALEGRCLMRLGRHAEAAGVLEQAAKQEPPAAGLDLDLVEARYLAGDSVGASRALAAAEANDPDRARLQLYKGLLWLDEGRTLEGASALDRARRLDPAAVEPVASLRAGTAWREVGERARGRVALERVIEEWPGTEWADAAERALADDDEDGSAFFASFELGYEYDTNVVLRGSGVALPREITSEQDDRFVWDLEFGRVFRLGDQWRAGVLVQDVGSLHDDLRSFDVHAPTLVGWLDRALGATTLARVELDVGYAWVDRAPFLLSYGATVLLTHGWGAAGVSEVSARFYRDGYFFASEDVVDGPGRAGARCVDPDDVICGPRGLHEGHARNRDGNGLSVELRHLWELHPRLAVGAAYRFERFSARGSEYSFGAHGIELFGAWVLPWDFGLSGEVIWAWQSFRHASTFPDPDDLVGGREYPLDSSDRRQRILRAEVTLEKPLTRHVTLLFRYRYIRERSNVAVFDYRREVLGAYLRLAL